MSEVAVVGAAIVDAGRCLVALRSQRMGAGGLWEFPGGKVEPGETPEAALQRELAEELGVAVLVHEHLGRGSAASGSRTIVLDVYRAEVARGTPEPREHSALRWVAADELSSLTWAPADLPILPAVRRLLEEHGDGRQLSNGPGL